MGFERQRTVGRAGQIDHDDQPIVREHPTNSITPLDYQNGILAVLEDTKILELIQ